MLPPRARRRGSSSDAPRRIHFGGEGRRVPPLRNEVGTPIGWTDRRSGAETRHVMSAVRALRFVRRAIALVYVVGVFYLGTVNVGPLPRGIPSDKVGHVVAFLGLE